MSFVAIWLALVAVVWLYMTACFMLSRLRGRADLIDTAWGLGFVVVAWTAWFLEGRSLGIKLAAAEFVTLWGVRLALHIYLRNRGKGEDHRYEAYKQKWGRVFWRTAYLRLFLIQGVLLLAISTTTIAIMTAHKPALLWLAIAGFVIWAVGIVVEAEADAELAKFVRHKKPGEIMTSGLWRYSRHPNYFGEITAWWGATIVAISLGQWWGIVGALLITFLITKISGIPLLEKHYADNPAFQTYKKHTSVLIPLPPKR